MTASMTDHDRTGPEPPGAETAERDRLARHADADVAGDAVGHPQVWPVAWLALRLIGGYQRFISPMLPSACRFYPTCSVYGYEAIAKYGIIKGGRLAIWRIMRCNPFVRGGFDPVD